MRPAVKKISTVAMRGNEIFRELKLTVGLDLGDRANHYCILDEAGNVILRASKKFKGDLIVQKEENT